MITTGLAFFTDPDRDDLMPHHRYAPRDQQQAADLTAPPRGALGGAEGSPPSKALDPSRNTGRPASTQPAVAPVIGSDTRMLSARPGYAGALTLAMKPRTSDAGSEYASPRVSSIAVMNSSAQSGKS